MAKRPRFPAEVRERAVRLVYEQEKEHKSQWAAITAIAGKIGCSAQTLSSWIKRRDVDAGRRSGITTEEQARVKELLVPSVLHSRGHRIPGWRPDAYDLGSVPCARPSSTVGALARHSA